MHTEYEYLISQEPNNMSDFDGYPGHGGFYEPAPSSDTPAPQPAKPAKVEFIPDYLKLAQRHMDDYERRINLDSYHFHDIIERQVFEDRAYKLAMLNAAYAQAEAATRQAEVMESLMEFAADLFGGTNIINALEKLSEK